MLAAGFIDLVVEASMNLWDIAALIPIVEGAGGLVTAWDGGPVGADGRGCWRWAIPGCTNPRWRSLPPLRHPKASERLGTATVASPMQADMDGKVCVVTGASSGIGRVTALGLAERGATVVLICRNEERGGPVLEETERRGGSGSATLLTADLSSQRQVREVAAAFSGAASIASTC